MKFVFDTYEKCSSRSQRDLRKTRSTPPVWKMFSAPVTSCSARFRSNSIDPPPRFMNIKVYGTTECGHAYEWTCGGNIYCVEYVAWDLILQVSARSPVRPNPAMSKLNRSPYCWCPLTALPIAQRGGFRSQQSGLTYSHRFGWIRLTNTKWMGTKCDE